jgi:hypothetical protein
LISIAQIESKSTTEGFDLFGLIGAEWISVPWIGTLGS